MHKKKLLAFLAAAYGISWLIWMPNVLAAHFDVGWEHSNWLHIAGGFGPFLGALLTTVFFGGWKGLGDYVRKKILSFPGMRWIIIGAGMPVVFFLAAYALLGVLTGDWAVLPQVGLNSKVPFTNPLLIWLLWCIFYGLGEEGGWRGFLFPLLAEEHSARMATLYTAFIWIPWHLPVFFYDKDFRTMGGFGAAGWAVGIVFGSLLLGWLVKQAKFNLWPVILWHGTFNFFTASDRINPLYPGLMSAMVIAIALWLARRSGESLEWIQRPAKEVE